MGVLQDALERIVKSEVEEEALTARVVRRLLHRRGLAPSPERVEAVGAALTCATDGQRFVDVEVEPGKTPLRITTEELDSAIEAFGSEMEGKLTRAVPEVAETTAASVLTKLYEDAARALGDHRRHRRGFERRLRTRWRQGLERMEMLIIISEESGEMFLDDINGAKGGFRGEMSEEERTLLDALFRLHARACRVAREVLCLLEAGFADGAHARWRSLHEIAVVASFLRNRGGARRYLDHAAVERYRASQQYELHCERLGYPPPSPEELAEAERQYRDVVSRYGESFANDYGWAAAALGHPNPRFTDIERQLQLSHWRPHFRLACQNVHAGSQSLYDSFGVGEADRLLLLTGPSDAGLCDPGHCCGIALTMVSAALFSTRPTLDSVVTARVMTLLTDDLGEALLDAHELGSFPRDHNGCRGSG